MWLWVKTPVSGSKPQYPEHSSKVFFQSRIGWDFSPTTMLPEVGFDPVLTHFAVFRARVVLSWTIRRQHPGRLRFRGGCDNHERGLDGRVRTVCFWWGWLGVNQEELSRGVCRRDQIFWSIMFSYKNPLWVQVLTLCVENTVKEQEKTPEWRELQNPRTDMWGSAKSLCSFGIFRYFFDVKDCWSAFCNGLTSVSCWLP